MRGLFILIGYFHVITLLAQPNRAVFLALLEGLSNQQVLDIAHDESGVTWVATELGLNRFVGNTFKRNYASENQNGISVNSNEINRLLYDDNKLYVGRRYNWLIVLDIHTNRIMSQRTSMIYKSTITKLIRYFMMTRSCMSVQDPMG